jgi:hypothetical protein
MSDPTIARGETADLLEQTIDVVRDEPSDTPPDIGWEADAADILEHHRDLGIDDERDDEHQG